MRAKIQSISIRVETDKGVLERKFSSIAEVVDFIGSLHPKAAAIAGEVNRAVKIMNAVAIASEALAEDTPKKR